MKCPYYETKNTCEICKKPKKKGIFMNAINAKTNEYKVWICEDCYSKIYSKRG